MTMLVENFTMTQLGRFERRTGNYITLYAIGNPAQFDEGALRAFLSLPNAEARAASLTVNPSLIWQSDTSLAGWSVNGDVALEPLDRDRPSGVLVRNNDPFGGIRQVIEVNSLQRSTVTAIVTIEGIGPEPAQSAVIALSREGAAPFSQIFVPLIPGDNLVILEAQLPADTGMLRITVATGKDDNGDLAIQHAYLIPETIDQIIQALESQTVQNSGGS